MSFVQKVTVDLLSTASGAVTAYSPTLNGRIVAVKYLKDATTPLASTSDFTVTTETTGQAVYSATNINASALAYPVAAAAVGGVTPSTLTEAPICVADERVKIVVAQGGAAKVGQFVIIVA